MALNQSASSSSDKMTGAELTEEKMQIDDIQHHRSAVLSSKQPKLTKGHHRLDDQQPLTSSRDSAEPEHYMPCRPTLDPYLTPNVFTNSNKDLSSLDETIKEALSRRLATLSPTSTELAQIGTLQDSVTKVLNQMADSEDMDVALIESVHQVGSYKMGTILRGHCTADLVIVLKTLPLTASFQPMAEMIREKLAQLEYTNSRYVVQVSDDYMEVHHKTSKVFLRFIANKHNLKLLDSAAKKHFSKCNLWAIDHARWFENNVRHNLQVINLIRVIKQMTIRFDHFGEINPWMIINMANYCMTYTPNEEHLPIGTAFKRMFQLMSAGIFLPYSEGIPDPLKPTMPIHGRLDVRTLDTITSCAQTLFRILNQKGGIDYVLDLESEPRRDNPLEVPTKWGEVIIYPSVPMLQDSAQDCLPPNKNQKQ